LLSIHRELVRKVSSRSIMTSLLIHSEFFGGDTSPSTKDLFEWKQQQQLPSPRIGAVPQHNHTIHDARYYVSCCLAGGLSSGIRWVLSPLELIKTRMQAAGSSSIMHHHPLGIAGTFRSIYAHEGGAVGLWRGLGPTAVAYWFQTSTKYGLYEVLKDQLSSSSSTGEKQQQHLYYKGLIYVTAAASAEAVADVLMCPWEMLKVKMQTAGKSSTFPSQLVPALQEMTRNRQRYNFPFGLLGPLWGRQIPGTIVNFYTFENAVAMIYAVRGQPKQDYSALQQLGVTYAAGYIAGFCSAVVSHPADSLVSLMSMPEHAGQSCWQITKRVGLYRLATKGLAPRILVTGQIISVQWLLYDSFKSLMGFGTTGGNS
jgi:solute carrier family 25 (mitochondrial phosphate transporter), member 3